MKSHDLISNILNESQAYSTFSDIEKLVESGQNLANIPIQPLYLTLVNTSDEHIATVLPRLSTTQRQALLDLDLWHKDAIDLKSFDRWPIIYSQCTDEKIVYEFIQSEEFLLYLKSHVVIATFDVEDPEYPDHDYYFLTEDNLLLVEYGENFEAPDVLKKLIKELYSALGVENAYSFLFKLISDNYILLEEESYQRKKEFLRDYGFVDYFDALEMFAPFMTLKQIDSYILNRKILDSVIENELVNQSLHPDSLAVFNQNSDIFTKELSGITDVDRERFLHFNFVKSINAAISFDDSLKGGKLALSKTSKKARTNMTLGFQYIKNKTDSENIFTRFDFIDLYKIGHSLIEIHRRKLKKSLLKSPFEQSENESFLGNYWINFLEMSFDENPKVRISGSGENTELDNIEKFQYWCSDIEVFVQLLPFIQSFYLNFKQLKEDQKLRDEFYLNYSVETIDFESIILSSLANFMNGYLPGQDHHAKLGLSVDEYKKFMLNICFKNHDEYILKSQNDKIIMEGIDGFCKQFGFNSVENIHKYIYSIMLENLSGYELDKLNLEDYKHVGGPIILNLI
jgi:hypothetical protein